MHQLTRLILVAGVLITVAGGSRVHAQGPGFGGGGGFVFIAPNVQKELKFTEEQTGKVRETAMELGAKYRDQFTAARELPESERPAKMRELMKSLTDDVKQSLSLSAEQAKRYDQIVLQTRGLQAFMDRELREKLQITSDQQQKLGELGTEFRQKAEAIRRDAGDDREEAMKKFQELRKEYADKTIALLSDDQKKTWKEMTGEPFEVKFERPGQ